jgi:hypothetical protein
MVLIIIFKTSKYLYNILSFMSIVDYIEFNFIINDKIFKFILLNLFYNS